MFKVLVSLFLLFFNTVILFGQSCNLLTEGFEGATNAVPPSGWQLNGSYIGTINPNTGTTHAGFNTLGDELIVRPLTCPGQICFSWRASGTTSNFDVDVEWSQDGGLNWNKEYSISLTGASSPTTYAQACVDLPEQLYQAPFQNILIRFVQSRRVGGSLYLDDICISSGSCTVTPTRFDVQLPAACIQTGSPFSVYVCATDSAGNQSNQYNGAISLSHPSGSGTLTGTLTQTASGGCALFNNLVLTNSDSLHQLFASGTNLSGTSNIFSTFNVCNSLDTIRVMSYNLLNFPYGRNDCGTNIVVPARWDTLAIILDYVKPDILMVCELQDSSGADSILLNALNKNGVTSYQRANFVFNQSSIVTSLNNMLFYNSDKVKLQRQKEIKTHLRDIGYYTLLVNDPFLASTGDSLFLDVYLAHLDAAAVDSLSRKRGCDTLRYYLDTATVDKNFIFGGDFNFYKSAESGYQTLLSGVYPLNDPINRPGDWSSDPAFADVHTQATRAIGTNSMDCGSLGGIDDRFDFVMASNPVMSGSKRIKYLPNSYKALGNSANLLNKSINDPLNSSGIPANVLNALFYMSDHLPVIMDLELTFTNPAGSTTNISASACDSFFYNNQTYYSSGIYSQLLQSQTGLDSLILLNLSIGSVDSSVTINATTLTSNDSAVGYQWLDCNNNLSPIIGENGQSFSPSTNGNFAVEVSNNGCIGTSACYPIIISNIDYHFNNENVVCYPNPFSDNINIVFENFKKEVSWKVFSMDGRFMKEGQNMNCNTFEIGLEQLAPSLYFLELSGDNFRKRVKVVKM